jgi:uncharacterized membrane protein YdbT with pleckstrin-like domain
MWRNHPVYFAICLALVAAYGVGLVILFFWWFQSIGITFTITQSKVIKRTGVFSKHTSEMYISDVRNVRVQQSFLDRIFFVGTVSVASSGTDQVELEIRGLPSPHKIKAMIDGQRMKI